MAVAALEQKKIKKNLRYERDKDREPVRGIFHFYEVPGGKMSFVYRKYKEDPIERFDLVDNETCTIPLGVAKHLNKSGGYPIHEFKLGVDGKSDKQIGKIVRRYGFQSLEFTDIEGVSTADEPVIEEFVEMNKEIV